jgi:hypothetical protein
LIKVLGIIQETKVQASFGQGILKTPEPYKTIHGSKPRIIKELLITARLLIQF